MKQARNDITMLMADDDEEDCLLARDALREARLANVLNTVGDGEELLDYLQCRGKYQARRDEPLPGLILLDLNMPRKSGIEALREIKKDPALRQIPIVVLTTSRAEEDILKTYNLGVSSFIVKPVTFAQLVEIMKTLATYWFEIVELPADPAR